MKFPITTLHLFKILSIIIFLYFFLKLCLYYYNRYKCLIKLPAPPVENSWCGNAVVFRTSPENIFKTIRRWSLEYYPIFRVSLFIFWVANFVGPEDFELILSNPKHNSKSMLYELLHSWLGTGLLTSNDEKWQMRRKMLTPTFHFSILKKFMVIFNEETNNLIEILKEKCQDNREIEIFSIVSQYALKTITETAMGTKLDFKSKAGYEYKQALYEFGNLLVHRLFRPWLGIPWMKIFFLKNWMTERNFLRILHGFTRNVIHERKENFQSVTLSSDESDFGDDVVYSKKKRLAMLDLLLSVQKEEGIIDDEGIREEVDTFMFEGHDTTAAALCYSLLMIACHKDVQDKLIEEMREVLGDITKNPTLTELQELKYLECCIKETLRLYPSVHFISRRLGEELITSTGYKLTEGTWVCLHIYDLHHNPNIYPDPEKFDPDRFTPENIQKRHPFAYVPFSAGPRNCIGQRFAMAELKAAICGILGNFILEPIDTPENMVLVVHFILRTKDPLKIRFIPRNE